MTTDKRLFTIGHSSHSVDFFLNLLRQNEIEVVVDVRSAPYSRFVPQFNKSPIERELKANGFHYIFMGQDIGGKPADSSLYDAGGRVRYELVASQPAFQQGIVRLKKGLGDNWRIALMCAEEDPLQCHRHLLIAKELEQHHNVEVLHLRADEPPMRAKKFLGMNARQMKLF